MSQNLLNSHEAGNDTDSLAASYGSSPEEVKERMEIEENAKAYIYSQAPKKYHEALVPNFALGCKRRIFDPNYLSSLHLDHVDLIAEGIREITKTGIISESGYEEDFDIIILATGFQVSNFLTPMQIVGKTGIAIKDQWESKKGAQAYMGTFVHNFPNFGMLFGPNTFPAFNSVIYAVEVQVDYLAKTLFKTVIDGYADVVEVSEEAEARFVTELDKTLAKTVFNSGCNNWYINSAGRYALVTGGASGIGRAIVRLLAREACAGIAVADINADALATVQKELVAIATNKDFKCIIVNVDVRDESSVAEMVKNTTESFGRIDYAVNCAGIGLKKPLADTDLKEWDRMMGINMTGVFLCMKAEINQMITQEPTVAYGAYAPMQRGAIVNIASLSAIAGLRHSGAYTAAKHGVAGITRTAALDYPEIKCNAIAPGYIKTPLTDAPGAMRDNALVKVNEWTPMKRFGLPEEIAEGVVWLLGSRSNFVHGSCLVMDGGYLTQ
ncbi:hypothetical protein SLS64_011125 [Diaporthe eres]